jgi:hypothetical protein
LEDGLLKKGMMALELALQYLDKKKDDIAEWTSDEAYKKYRGLMIRNGLMFSDHYPLYQPYRTFAMLRSVLFDVEESYLVADIGRDLLAFLRTQNAMEIDAEGGKVDVIHFVRKAAANFTVKHALKKLSVRFNEHGFTVMGLNGGDIERQDVAARTDAAGWQYDMQFRDADMEGQNWLTRAKKYLKGIADGIYNNDWGNDFTTAFENSPLNSDNETVEPERGNDKRKIFVF